MSRFTWLKSTDVAAICGFPPTKARRLCASLDSNHWSWRQATVQASKLVEEFERQQQPLPPLLIALVNDEREYPAWLAELKREYRYAKQVGLTKRDRAAKPRVANARNEAEARAIMESLPDIEARGYLEDEGLPPEYRMDDRLYLARGDEDEDG